MEEKTYSIADLATGTLFPVRNICDDASCRFDHGMSALELKWFYSEPTTVFARSDESTDTGTRQDFVVSRELLLQGLRSGTGSGFPVVGEGNVMCQVLRDNRSLICISFNEGYLVLAERASLTEWLMSTYVHVPPALEVDILDIDRVIAQLLYK